MSEKKKIKKASINVDALKPYREGGYDLIPLHKWNKEETRKGKKRQRGKSPRDMDWRGKLYKYREIEENAAHGGNTGVRLRAEDLVIDVDPRNFPEDDDVLERFEEDFDLDLTIAPKVDTGSGGVHYYFTKPADCPVRDSLEDYPGIEFKSRGRQVVAAGSVHPNGKGYDWDEDAPSLDEVPKAPGRLLRIIKRPQVDNRSQGGGEHSAEEIATMLNLLDAEDYRDHDDWFRLMQACHHASGGDARMDFIEWSTRDPEYSDASWDVGRRWDSLDRARSDGVTVRTLHKELRDRGLQEQIPRPAATEDFKEVGDAEPPDFGVPEHERLSSLEKMNRDYVIVDENGKFRVYRQALDPSFEPARNFWVRYTWWDFCQLNVHRRIERAEKTIELTKAWIEWPKKNQVQGIVFDPEREHPGYLNLWTGWGVEPKKGDWSLLQELIFEVLADGSRECEEYIMNWMADMVQNPGRPAEVAICFQGKKGTGKGTLGRALCTLAGRHGLHITSPEHLTGRFNSHLRDVVFLFADEAIAPQDREANSRLKGLITEPTIALEGKGVDLVTTKNLNHVCMASNEQWMIPAGLEDERRFFVTRVNEKRRGDHAFFRKLHKQMENGGYQAMLFDLLHRDLGSFRPRSNIPWTRAMLDQKMRGLSPIAMWWLNCLEQSDLLDVPLEDGEHWDDFFHIRVFAADLHTSYQDWCRPRGIKPGAGGKGSRMLFMKELKELAGPSFRDRTKKRVPSHRGDVSGGIHADGRAWSVDIPPLSECRAEMEKKLGGNPGWDEEDDPEKG